MIIVNPIETELFAVCIDKIFDVWKIVAVYNVDNVSTKLNIAVFTVPVKVGDARFAFKFNAVCVAVDTGFNKSVVLLQFPKPTIVDVIPPTVPVKVGDARLAF